MTPRALSLYAVCTAALLLLLSPRAEAQFGPRRVTRAAVGEKYHVEISAASWGPTADMSLTSSATDVPGTTINLKNDLGLADRRVFSFDLVLKPAPAHKFRVQLVPIKYSQTATPRAPLVFAGQTYPAGVPVTSSIDWKAWRFGYEYDFAVGTRGFMGVIVDVKYTDAGATLSTTSTAARSAIARAPIPAIGGILRINPAANVSLTGEVTGFKLPGSWFKGTSGHYLDVDAYATVNFVNAFGVQFGYRSFDLGYTLTNDTGDFKLEGVYVGAVVRF